MAHPLKGWHILNIDASFTKIFVSVALQHTERSSRWRCSAPSMGKVIAPLNFTMIVTFSRLEPFQSFAMWPILPKLVQHPLVRTNLTLLLDSGLPNSAETGEADCFLLQRSNPEKVSGLELCIDYSHENVFQISDVSPGWTARTGSTTCPRCNLRTAQKYPKVIMVCEVWLPLSCWRQMRAPEKESRSSELGMLIQDCNSICSVY